MGLPQLVYIVNSTPNKIYRSIMFRPEICTNDPASKEFSYEILHYASNLISFVMTENIVPFNITFFILSSFDLFTFLCFPKEWR